MERHCSLFIARSVTNAQWHYIVGECSNCRSLWASVFSSWRLKEINIRPFAVVGDANVAVDLNDLVEALIRRANKGRTLGYASDIHYTMLTGRDSVSLMSAKSLPSEFVSLTSTCVSLTSTSVGSGTCKMFFSGVVQLRQWYQCYTLELLHQNRKNASNCARAAPKHWGFVFKPALEENES